MSLEDQIKENNEFVEITQERIAILVNDFYQKFRKDFPFRAEKNISMAAYSNLLYEITCSYMNKYGDNRCNSSSNFAPLMICFKKILENMKNISKQERLKMCDMLFDSLKQMMEMNE